MSKKNKLIICSLFVLALIISSWISSILSEHKQTNKAITWIEQQGGSFHIGSNRYIEKCPEFSRALLMQLVGARITILSNAQVIDLSPLKSMKTTNELYLEGTQVTDLSPLKNMTQMKYLNIAGTQVTDLSPLNNMTHLKSLNITDTLITTNDINDLQLKIPNLKIVK